MLGRPSDYTEDKAKIICDRIAAGETITAICQDEDMPSKPAVYRWLEANEDFRNQYARAREMQADTFADLILNVAFDKQGDTLIDEYGNAKPNHEYINRSRLKIDALKWHASKTAPKKYGDKLELSGDKESPIEINASIDLSKATTDQLMDIVKNG